MSTKITVYGAVPAETTGADVANAGPYTISALDQNFANLRAAADRALTALGGFSASQTPGANQIPVVKGDLSTVFPGGGSFSGNLFSTNGIVRTGASYAGSIGMLGTLTNHALWLMINSSPVAVVDTSGNITPYTNATQALGSTSQRWSQVWCQAGVFNSSDARLKTAVRSLTANEIKAAQALASEIGTYQWLESVALKGLAEARFHVGLTVQRAIEIMAEHELNPFAYGFIGYDKWDDVVVNHPATEDAAAWSEVIRPAGDAFSFRYDELNQFICAGQQAAITSQDSRLSALESQLTNQG